MGQPLEAALTQLRGCRPSWALPSQQPQTHLVSDLRVTVSWCSTCRCKQIRHSMVILLPDLAASLMVLGYWNQCCHLCWAVTNQKTHFFDLGFEFQSMWICKVFWWNREFSHYILTFKKQITSHHHHEGLLNFHLHQHCFDVIICGFTFFCQASGKCTMPLLPLRAGLASLIIYLSF